jgi:hypothetical protein
MVTVRGGSLRNFLPQDKKEAVAKRQKIILLFMLFIKSIYLN